MFCQKKSLFRKKSKKGKTEFMVDILIEFPWWYQQIL